MTVGCVATIPLLVLVPLSGCLELEDEGAQCSSASTTVHSVVVQDGQSPRGDIVRLDVLVTGSRAGFVAHQFAVTPWAGETVFRFPYRLNPIIANQDGGTVTVAVAARSTALDLVSSGAVTLESGIPAGCGIFQTFSIVEID